MEKNTKEILDGLIEKVSQFKKQAEGKAPDTDKKEEISTSEMVNVLRKEAEDNTKETKEEKTEKKPEETKEEKSVEDKPEKKTEEKKTKEIKEEKPAEEYPVEIIPKEAAIKLIENMDNILKEASFKATIGKTLLGIGGAGVIGAGAYQAGKLKERAVDVKEDRAIAQAFYRVGAKAATEAILSRMNAGEGV